MVEGPSDKDALIPYIENKLFVNKMRVTVKEMHGDILTAYVDGQRIYKILPGNVRGELKKEILKYFNKASVKAEQIKARDITKIYYVTDTDYCFHSELDAHKNKSQCLRKMFNFGEMELVKNKPIDFNVIYFSKHLEHVIANKEETLSEEEKQRISIEFGTRSLLEESFYEKHFRDKDIATWSDYAQSYKNIQSYKGRACNMNNFLDELDQIFKNSKK